MPVISCIISPNAKNFHPIPEPAQTMTQLSLDTNEEAKQGIARHFVNIHSIPAFNWDDSKKKISQPIFFFAHEVASKKEVGK